MEIEAPIPELEDQKPSINLVKLFIRILFFGLLGIALVVALLENLSKKAAMNTDQAIHKALTERISANEELHRADLKALIKGSPSITSGDSDKYQESTGAMDTYRWRLLRSYELKIYYDKLPKDNPTVFEIENSWSAINE